MGWPDGFARVETRHEHSTRPGPDGLIALTCSEIRRLFTIYVIEPSRASTAWPRDHGFEIALGHFRGR